MREQEPVLEFERSRARVSTYFGCEEDIFVKPLLNFEWIVKQEEDFYFLSYWNTSGKKIDAVIVRRNGKPLIYQKERYTMVIAIDCVKIGFVFDNAYYMA